MVDQIIHPMGLRLTNGVELRRWKSWQVDSNVRTLPTTTWRATFGPADSDEVWEVEDWLRSNPLVQITMDGTVISTGRAMEIDRQVDRGDGSILNISGGDVMCQTANAKLQPGFQAHGEQTVRELIEYALRSWSIPVIGDASLDRRAVTTRRSVSAGLEADRGTVVDGGGAVTYEVASLRASSAAAVETRESRELHAKPGEAVLAWLRRILDRNNLLAWTTAAGELFVGRPDYSSPPVVHLIRRRADRDANPTEGDILSGGYTDQIGDQRTSVEVLGRGRGRSQVRAIAVNHAQVAAGWRNPEVIEDQECRDQADAERRARRVLGDSMVECWTWRCRMAGVGIGPRMPAQGAMVLVDDDPCRLHRSLFVASRSFKVDPDDGVCCDLVCIKPDLWAVE